jgi:hypothetical protein
MIRTKVIVIGFVLFLLPLRAEATTPESWAVRDCIDIAIPVLDDHISPANVIAVGVMVECRVKIDVLCAQEFQLQKCSNTGREGFEQGLMPYVINRVLKARKI